MILVLILGTMPVLAGPGEKSSKDDRREERRRARAERQWHRRAHPFDERTRAQKKLDLKIVLFMALGAGLAVKSLSAE